MPDAQTVKTQCCHLGYPDTLSPSISTHTHVRTRVHIKSIVGIEGHFRRAVLVLTGLKYLCNTSERKQGELIITGGEVQWHC